MFGPEAIGLRVGENHSMPLRNHACPVTIRTFFIFNRSDIFYILMWARLGQKVDHQQSLVFLPIRPFWLGGFGSRVNSSHR